MATMTLCDWPECGQPATVRITAKYLWAIDAVNASSSRTVDVCDEHVNSFQVRTDGKDFRDRPEMKAAS